VKWSHHNLSSNSMYVAEGFLSYIFFRVILENTVFRVLLPRRQSECFSQSWRKLCALMTKHQSNTSLRDLRVINVRMLY
jgi:hypothetical protein